MSSKSPNPASGPMDPEGPTGKLCTWVESIELQDVPEEIRTRAKYLILDGIGCGLVGAHLEHSELAAKGVMEMEGSGNCKVWGYEKGLPPLPAALLNSTFIQGFELDDWHSDAPLHSNAILLPALFSAAQHSSSPVSGSEMLLSAIVGYETGPRVGHALYGADIRSTGWHSGAVFGPPTSAAAVSKLLRLPAHQIEDALGIACTQAGGLMSAQYESMVKRMQHGFAARNGLFATLMAQNGYIGIKKVFEREYGGYLACFGRGSGKEPSYLVDEISKELGSTWQTNGIRVKLHSSMAATHCGIECIAALQQENLERFDDSKKIKSVVIELGEAAFHHGGWEARRPLTATGAQMSSRYCAAVQLVDGQVLPEQFSRAQLERDDVWELNDKTTCKLNHDLDSTYTTRVTIEFVDGKKLEKEIEAPKSVKPGLTNDEVVAKWRAITANVIDDRRRRRIEELVLGLDDLEGLDELTQLLAKKTANPIA